MALVDAKAAGAFTSTSIVAAAPAPTAEHLFLVVLDGVETPIHEGTTLHGSAGGTVTVTSPGQLSADGLHSVVLVRGGGTGAVRFTLCADAAAEGVGLASFDRCGAARVEGAREVSVSRCRAAEVERAGRVTLDRCRDARLRGGGALRAARCRRADVESFGGVRLARCRAARADWCGTVEVELCRAVDVTRCGAVTGERCRVVNAAGCGSVDVARAVINLVEEEQPFPASTASSSRIGGGITTGIVPAVAMPPLTAADDFLILEFIAGNRRIPYAVFDSLLACLSSPSAIHRTSQRLRQALVLRALDAALLTEGASSLVLYKARKVLADPDAAACFPHQISVTDNEENDEARAAAAVADLKRLLDLEWANLPPSTLERAADRIAGDGAHQTWAAADHIKLGESTEHEILSKAVQDGSASHQPIVTEVADNVSNANDADGAQRDDEAHSSNENSEADRGQEGMAGHQNASVKGGEGQVSEKSVPASKRCSLMERNPNASTYEWDSSDDDQPVRKRKLHRFERTSTCAHKIRKKWSEIEEKTLLEGVKKYGKGNWKDIKLAYPDVFEERSTVDLKDKFRNLERHHHESASA
ncbi:hypothetical protein SORBI_3001G190000 [Sorghum bicolor]|uniref:Uncharacterized protein n=2 Tax=Sorghum bicolor TaxID=4558 RepID=A0A1Z5S6C8_SORBI|nr:hypothetical protein SORBI_3001G190000 [Sorghum bicolor]